jgi:hypothetical protein
LSFDLCHLGFVWHLGFAIWIWFVILALCFSTI